MKTIGRYEFNEKDAKLLGQLKTSATVPFGFVLWDKVSQPNGLHHDTARKVKYLEAIAHKKGAELKVLYKEGLRVIIEITDPLAGSLETYLDVL